MMTGNEFKAIFRYWWGHGWQKQLAETLEVDVSTIRRTQNNTRIPKLYEYAVRSLFTTEEILHVIESREVAA